MLKTVLGLITLGFFTVPTFAQWNFSDYSKYNYKTFASSKIANTRIDFSNVDYKLLHAAVLFETNRQRVQNNRQPFLHSPALEKAALGHSVDMVKKNFFSHGSPIAGKETMGKRLKLVGISNAYTGENIAYSFGIEYQAGKPVYTLPNGQFSYSPNGPGLQSHTYLNCAKSVVKQWMNSPGHRRNILNANFKYLGVGAAYYKKGKWDYFKFTQNFASIKGP